MSTEKLPTYAADPFVLQRRQDSGGTRALSNWGFRNETDPLTDVLLGPADHLRHMATSSLSRKTLREHPADIRVARAQHQELQSAYAHFDVRIHWHRPEPELPMQVYARDSSVMTPYGAIITAMADWWRRGENFAAIRTYERLGIPIYDMVTAGTFEGGDFNVIEDGLRVDRLRRRAHARGGRAAGRSLVQERRLGNASRVLRRILRAHRSDGRAHREAAHGRVPRLHRARDRDVAESQGS